MTAKERNDRILELNQKVVDLMGGKASSDIPLMKQKEINDVRNEIHRLKAGDE